MDTLFSNSGAAIAVSFVCGLLLGLLGYLVGAFVVQAKAHRKVMLAREQVMYLRERLKDAEEQRDHAFELKGKALAVAVCERSRLKDYGDLFAIVTNLVAVSNGETMTVEGFDLYDASGKLLLREPEPNLFAPDTEEEATKVDVYE